MSAGETDFVELPHGACFNASADMVTIIFDRMTLSMSRQELADFAQKVVEIDEYLDLVVSTTVENCPTCGTDVKMTLLNIPDESDEN